MRESRPRLSGRAAAAAGATHCAWLGSRKPLQGAHAHGRYGFGVDGDDLEQVGAVTGGIGELDGSTWIGEDSEDEDEVADARAARLSNVEESAIPEEDDAGSEEFDTAAPPPPPQAAGGDGLYGRATQFSAARDTGTVTAMPEELDDFCPAERRGSVHVQSKDGLYTEQGSGAGLTSASAPAPGQLYALIDQSSPAVRPRPREPPNARRRIMRGESF